MSSSVYADEEGLAQTLSYLNSPLPLSSVHNVSTPSSDDAHSAHQSHSIPLPDILKASALTILVVWTILANFLVFIVLYKNPRLQTVPNLLVGNLAFSDFCLAMIVLPLSSVYACAGEWLFNETLCQVFVSADILCSTASIWNLSIVGLDRYWAITHPVQYLNKRNKKTACLMIVSCWCFSALISLAPLLGWKQVAEHGNLVQIKGQWQCTFLDLPSYTVYSATGSFFIPTLLMFFVYFKIYQAFAKHRARQIYRQKVIRRHIESTILHEISHILPTSDEFAKEAEDEEDEEEPEEEDKLDPQGAQMGAREVEQQLKRRTPLSTPMHDTIYEEEEEEEDDAEEEERDNIKFEDDCHSEAKEQRNGNVAKQHKDGPIGARERSNSCGGSGSDTPPSAVRFSGATIVQQAAPERAGPPCSVLVKTKRQWRSQSEAGPKRECSATVVKFSPKGGTAARVAAMREAGNESTTVSRRPTKNGSAAHHNAEEKTMPPYEKVKRHKKRKELNFRKSLQGKPRAISAAKERRGVRVLGIILGCFTLCWTPFFIMYVLVQFCAQCAVNPHIEMFITWLGYSNSAMNPIIYTVFNRDYQIALKRLFVGRKAMMGSSGGGVRPPMPLPSYLANKPKH